MGTTTMPTALLELAMLGPHVLLRGSPDVPGSDFDLNMYGKDVVIFTPQIVGGQRLRLFISKEDRAKTHKGKHWKAVVTDVPSGLVFVTKAATCGIPTCFCAARVVAVLVKP